MNLPAELLPEHDKINDYANFMQTKRVFIFD